MIQQSTAAKLEALRRALREAENAVEAMYSAHKAQVRDYFTRGNTEGLRQFADVTARRAEWSRCRIADRSRV